LLKSTSEDAAGILADGRFEPVSWSEASLALAGQRLRAMRAASGPDAVHGSRSLGPRAIATDSS